MKSNFTRASILRRLEKLEEKYRDCKAVPCIFVTVEPDGSITVGENSAVIFGSFSNMFEAEAYICTMRGVTKQTTIYVDDMRLMGMAVNLPDDPILYYCTPDERARFIQLEENPVMWMQAYIDLVGRIVLKSLKDPENDIPGLDDPALKDLIEHKSLMDPEQLLNRYKDNYWFHKRKENNSNG